MDGAHGFGILRSCERGSMPGKDGRFLPGDLVKSVAKVLRVIQADGCNDCGILRNGVCCIQSTAKTGLKDDEIHLLLCKIEQSNGKGELEEGGWSFPCADDSFHALDEPCCIGIRNLCSLHPYALVEAHKMRRSEETGFVSRSACYGLCKGAHGTLTVRARYVNDPCAWLRYAEFRQQVCGACQPQLDAEHLRRIQPIQCFGVVHQRGNFSVAVRLGLVRTIHGNAQIIRLFGGELGEVHAKFFEVQASHFFIQLLGQHTDAGF